MCHNEIKSGELRTTNYEWSHLKFFTTPEERGHSWLTLPWIILSLLGPITHTQNFYRPMTLYFLLLARYVLNVAKRSIILTSVSVRTSNTLHCDQSNYSSRTVFPHTYWIWCRVRVVTVFWAPFILSIHTPTDWLYMELLRSAQWRVTPRSRQHRAGQQYSSDRAGQSSVWAADCRRGAILTT